MAWLETLGETQGFYPDIKRRAAAYGRGLLGLLFQKNRHAEPLRLVAEF